MTMTIHPAEPTFTPPLKILVVDDDPVVSGMLGATLESAGYGTLVANSGEDALAMLIHGARDSLPALIILDVEMWGGIDGFEVCRQLKADSLTRDIPVIFLTSMSDPAYEQLGLNMGAVDYISKPISPPIVKARIKIHLTLKAAADFLHDRNTYLEQEVIRRTQESMRRSEELQQSQEVTIVALASLAETRDNDTGNHIIRTQHYVRILANYMKSRLCLDEEFIDRMFKAAPLHDIGKVGIPDRILLKPGRLNIEEMTIMKTHTTLGQSAIENALMRVGANIPLLEQAKEIALYHHEKWDGTGYPAGISGEAIPLSARLMAVADVYDALRSKRWYKNSMSHEESRSIIVDGSGQHFDPDIIDAFIALEDEFQSIADKFADSNEHLALLLTRIGHATTGGNLGAST